MKCKKLISSLLSLAVILTCVAFPLNASAETIGSQPDYDKAYYIVRVKNTTGSSISGYLTPRITYSPAGIVKADSATAVRYRPSNYTVFGNPFSITNTPAFNMSEFQISLGTSRFVPNGAVVVDCLYQSAYVGAPLSYQQSGQTVYQTFTPSSGYSLIDAMIGDVNEDGFITEADAEAIFRYQVGLNTFTEKQLLAADVNFNGSIEVEDGLEILKYISPEVYNGSWSNFPSQSDFYSTQPVV